MFPDSSYVVQGPEGADDILFGAVFEGFVCGFVDGSPGFRLVSGVLQFAGELFGIEGSRVRDGYGVKTFGEGTYDVDDLMIILVGQDSNDEDDFLTREVAGEAVSEHGGSFRILSAVHDDGGILVHELESSVPDGMLQASADGVFCDRVPLLAENLGGSDGHGGVCALVGTEKRDEEIPDRCSRC